MGESQARYRTPSTYFLTTPPETPYPARPAAAQPTRRRTAIHESDTNTRILPRPFVYSWTVPTNNSPRNALSSAAGSRAPNSAWVDSCRRRSASTRARRLSRERTICLCTVTNRTGSQYSPAGRAAWQPKATGSAGSGTHLQPSARPQGRRVRQAAVERTEIAVTHIVGGDEADVAAPQLTSSRTSAL
jgi:hypothetical protein